ncbi:glycosyltransferase [Halanaeroarchaeum sulfurireducens]|uniref:Glycosyltransferase, type 1 n=1 Tax=Halanaeroarchaeum sulfurireducens TaxID=1604004 RepID=A0A0N9MVV0_9EURY|nr:glycosyltransferase [Halanaeroarchaeum sulfurireducens]ALG81605.1 glycosyltransferase, type 1 [Halanaeroarchaeum sulfurireducens]
MRVAFVSASTRQHEPTDRAERLHTLATELADRGHEIDVFTTQWWDGDPDTFEHDGIEYRAVTQQSTDWQFPFRVPGLLNKFDPDVPHADCNPSGYLLGAKAGGSLARTPVLAECYDPPTAQGTVGQTLSSLAVRSAGAVVTPSRTVRTRVRELGVSTEAVDVVPTGIEMERIRALEPADGGDIVYSRRLDEAANLETLLLALAEFREYDWTATVIGDGPERASYERQARDLRIQDRVDFVGERSIDERIALFKNAHVYVHTAEYTPFAVDLLRALAAGCVGLVEYHAESSAHELVEQRRRGFTATSAQELTERLAAAGDLERLNVDESFAEFDRRTFLERYLERYRELQS